MVERLSGDAGIGIELGFLALSTLFVCLRLWVRLRLQPGPTTRLFSTADVAVVLAWASFTYMALSDLYTWHVGVWTSEMRFTSNGSIQPIPRGVDDTILELSFRMIFAAGIMQYLSLWFVKVAFIRLYYGMITKGGSARLGLLRFVLDCTAAMTAVGFVVMLGMNLFWCWPVSRNWSLEEDRFCGTWSKYPVYFTTLAFHLLTDILIYTLPFFLIPILSPSLPRRKRLGVSLMFALGFVSIICTVGRAVMVGTSFWVTNCGAFSSAEIGTAIMVACCPPLKLLLSRKGRSGLMCGKRRSSDGTLSIVEGVDRDADADDAESGVTRTTERTAAETFVTAALTPEDDDEKRDVVTPVKPSFGVVTDSWHSWSGSGGGGGHDI